MKMFEVGGGEFANVINIIQKAHNRFSRDVLKRYKNQYTRCFPENQEKFMLECRFYNMIIFRDKRIVHVNEYFKDGILFVHQLMAMDAKYLTYHNLDIDFLVSEVYLIGITDTE